MLARLPIRHGTTHHPAPDMLTSSSSLYETHVGSGLFLLRCTVL
jgi:hypothetical protein